MKATPAPFKREDFDRVLEPGAHRRDYWREAWRHRNLFWNLVMRDLRVRYKQTALGVAWGLLRPLLTMVAFTIVFGTVAGLPSEGDHAYAVMVFAGLIPWQLFSTGILHGAVSLTQNRTLVTRVYFPRVILPAAALANGLVDLLIAFALLLVMLVLDGGTPSWRLFAAPLFILMAFAASFGIALWLAALNVRYRDFSYIAPFLLQIGLFVSPVGFSSATVPEAWRLAYAVNPMVGAIDGLRWSLFETSAAPSAEVMAMSATSTVLLLVSGLIWFRRSEAGLADTI